MGIVHVVERCVRRAFLAGIDQATGKDYSFRREWIRRRMELLASVFGLRLFPGKRLEEHLGEPTDADLEQVLNTPGRIALLRKAIRCQKNGFQNGCKRP